MSITSFEFHIEDFMLFCTSKNLAPKTTKSYEQTLKLFSLYLCQEHTIEEVEEVKASHIRHYIKYLQERGKYTVQTTNQNTNFPENRTDRGKNLSNNTINNYIRNIKVFFNYLSDEKIIRDNPVERIKFLKKIEKIKESLTQIEIKKILSRFDVTTFHDYRNWLITRLLLTTGARIGETLSLEDDNIDFRHNTILFKDTKNKKEKIGYFTSKISHDLKRWIGYRTRYLDMNLSLLFPTNRGSKLTVQGYERALRKAANRAKVDSVHPHRLRATFAIEFLKNGGSIHVLAKILDHASVETTRVYLNLTEKELREQFMKYNPTQNLNF